MGVLPGIRDTGMCKTMKTGYEYACVLQTLQKYLEIDRENYPPPLIFNKY
ncbi:hypothetical protein HMPREF0645_0417 [Hallella bergensis DSM 17361]|uniref:Uncharacterized protein n=1 Tax=Hallella bergensis DSM 17361 TaxID=585502 RepID=D1PTY2_9BACT|nr:hypothetical protein HMPREF0645_0417 [Hallella bergensis DSM 17361]